MLKSALIVPQSQAMAAIALIALGSFLGASAQTLVVTDTDILNFALQSECLAASFWTAAAFGTNLTDAQLGESIVTKAREQYLLSMLTMLG